MDIEIKSAIDALRVDIRQVDGRVQALDDRVTATEVRLRQEIREENVTTRRHFDVVAESLRDDIRLIAEGLVALDAKVEVLRGSR